MTIYMHGTASACIYVRLQPTCAQGQISLSLSLSLSLYIYIYIERERERERDVRERTLYIRCVWLRNVLNPPPKAKLFLQCPWIVVTYAQTAQCLENAASMSWTSAGAAGEDAPGLWSRRSERAQRWVAHGAHGGCTSVAAGHVFRATHPSAQLQGLSTCPP